MRASFRESRAPRGVRTLRGVPALHTQRANDPGGNPETSPKVPLALDGGDTVAQLLASLAPAVAASPRVLQQQLFDALRLEALESRSVPLLGRGDKEVPDVALPAPTPPTRVDRWRQAEDIAHAGPAFRVAPVGEGGVAWGGRRGEGPVSTKGEVAMSTSPRAA